jgi:hypothetical protein
MEPLAGTLIAKIGNGPPVRQITSTTSSPACTTRAQSRRMQFTGRQSADLVGDEK